MDFSKLSGEGGHDSDKRVVQPDPNRKLAGLLVPVFALRGKNDLGIGDTASLKELIAWSAAHGFGVVQILPVNETGADCSPYNLLSAMALEPMTLAATPDVLADLDQKTYKAITGKYDLCALRKGNVDYGTVRKLKGELFWAAYENFRHSSDRKRLAAFQTFQKENAGWLEVYSLHRALVTKNGTAATRLWSANHQSILAARAWLAGLDEEEAEAFNEVRAYHVYLQWIAYRQWSDVRTYADEKGVALMGDLPVGVSIDSTDVWSQPEIFDPVRSSGAPPEKVFKSDPFTEQWGQNWGFPLYKWEQMAQDNYAWWRMRFQLLMKIFHLMRVDHALGFFRIYSFPWRPERNTEFVGLQPEEAVKLTHGPLPGFVARDDSSEENREFNRLRGEAILKVFLEETGLHCLVAEDLGEVAPYVRPTLKKLEIPGFKIPQWERHWDRLIPGSEYERLSLATFATHDHPPIRTFWSALYEQSQSKDETIRDAAIHSMWEFMDFCGHPETKLPQQYTPAIHEKFIRGLFASNSWLAVHMVTDLMGTDERFNVPGLAGALNWTERISEPVAGWDKKWSSELAMTAKALQETGRTLK